MMLQERHTTTQRNNNARITSGKTSDQGSSHSSNLQLSNRSLLSGKTKDSKRSKRDKSSPEARGNTSHRDGHNSKNSESSSPGGLDKNPFRYTSTPVSGGPRNISGLSNISEITTQSNNNARITTGKTSDQGSSPSSNQELSNRSLISGKTKDSKKSKSGWITCSTKTNKDVAKIPDTVPGVKEIRTLASKPEIEIDKPKRKKSNIPMYTPERNNGNKDVAKIPETVPGAKEIRTLASKPEIEIDKPKRKKSNIPIYTPERNKSTPKGVASDKDHLKKIAQSLVTKTNRPRHRGESDGDSRLESTPKTISKKAQAMASTISQKKSQTHQKIINRPAMESTTTLKRKSFANSSKDNLKQERIKSGFHTPNYKEDGRLRSKPSSKKEYNDVSSKSKRLPMSVGVSGKTSGDRSSFKRESESKPESTSTKRRPDNSSLKGHHIKEVEATPSPANDLDPVQVQKYFDLLDLYQKNEEKIDELKQRTEIQEQEMDDVYTDTRGEIEKLIGSTAEVVEARRIHRNFKNEATRARVHHKTNLITAELYTMENIFLQEQIAELQQQINEAKAINSLTPEELKEKIHEIRGYYNDQKQRNDEMVEQIEKLKDTLNEYKCGSDAFTAESTMPIQSTQTGHDDVCEIKPNPVAGYVDGRAGYSKSEDNVANMKWQDGPRETKSDHTGENRIQKTVDTTEALMPDRRQTHETFTEGISHQISTSAARIQTRPLLLKRHHKVTDTVPDTLNEGHNEESVECVSLEVKPDVCKRAHQQEHHLDRNGLVHTPHPPAYPCPDGRRSRKLRKINHTPPPGNK